MKKLFLCCVLCTYAHSLAQGALEPGETPALVVVISVDQLAYEYLDRFRPGFDDRGIFRRFEREGAWYTNCHHRHGVTTTAPGHSVQLTGAYPSTNGIVDNGWFDRTTGKLI
jgi:predicted AlkP superfamily pyrophosphatase or phosphodiesterase